LGFPLSVFLTSGLSDFPMTKNEIIARFYTSKEFNDCISRIKPINLQDDLKNEVAEVLCGEEEWFIQELYTRGELKYWARRIIRNMGKSVSSPFAKTYRKFTCGLPAWYDVEQEETETIAERTHREHLEDRALASIDSLHWYRAELIKLYRKHGTFRKVADEAGVSFQSAQRTINKGCEELRKKCQL